MMFIDLELTQQIQEQQTIKSIECWTTTTTTWCRCCF